MKLQLVNCVGFLSRFVFTLLAFGAIGVTSVLADMITLRDGLDDGFGAYAGTTNSLLRGITPDTVNGAGAPSSLIVGTNGPAAVPPAAQNVNDRVLLGFDLTPILTAAGGMPVVVNSVEVQMFITTGGTVVGNGNRRVETGVAGGSQVATETVDIDLHAYGFVFNPATATWNDPAPGDGTDGGTLGALLASVTGLTSDPSNQSFPATSMTQQDFLSAALTQWVQDAVDNTMDPTARFLVNRPNADLDVRNRVFFASRTFGTATSRPTMVIDYTIVPEPNPYILAGISAFGLAIFARNARNRVK